MCERDEGVRLVAEQRNALETCVLELRAAKNGSHYKLFEAKAVEFGELLQAAEDWLWSDEASNADAIAKKKEQVLADAKALDCGGFGWSVEEARQLSAAHPGDRFDLLLLQAQVGQVARKGHLDQPAPVADRRIFIPKVE